MTRTIATTIPATRSIAASVTSITCAWNLRKKQREKLDCPSNRAREKIRCCQICGIVPTARKAMDILFSELRPKVKLRFNKYRYLR